MASVWAVKLMTMENAVFVLTKKNGGMGRLKKGMHSLAVHRRVTYIYYILTKILLYRKSYHMCTNQTVK